MTVPTVRIVPVALWPFDTPRAAVEAVIQALIDKLGEEVNVVALRRLPEAYADAMSAANSWVGATAKLQGGASPTETLAAIDRVAIATGRQFVVWIEDLERFAARADDAEEKLNPIAPPRHVPTATRNDWCVWRPLYGKHRRAPASAGETRENSSPGTVVSAVKLANK